MGEATEIVESAPAETPPRRRIDWRTGSPQLLRDGIPRSNPAITSRIAPFEFTWTLFFEGLHTALAALGDPEIRSLRMVSAPRSIYITLGMQVTNIWKGKVVHSVIRAINLDKRPDLPGAPTQSTIVEIGSFTSFATWMSRSRIAPTRAEKKALEPGYEELHLKATRPTHMPNGFARQDLFHDFAAGRQFHGGADRVRGNPHGRIAPSVVSQKFADKISGCSRGCHRQTWSTRTAWDRRCSDPDTGESPVRAGASNDVCLAGCTSR